ncbi:MAG: hypothetical protein M1457_03580 [bacterium]|nr:hypothetical protein [bacterium]
MRKALDATPRVFRGILFLSLLVGAMATTAGHAQQATPAPQPTATPAPLAAVPEVANEATTATIPLATTPGEMIPAQPATPSAPTTATLVQSAATTVTAELKPQPQPTATPRPALSNIAAPTAVTETVTPEAEKPAYLRFTKQESIFDPGKGEELTPLQIEAQRKEAGLMAQRLRSLANIKDLITYDYTIEGDNESQIQEEALLRALKSAAGRLYFGDNFLLGLSLLEPYLRQNGNKFILQRTVSDKKFLPNNKVQLTVKMSVNLDMLYSDLKEKHFIATPNLRPIVAVFLEETINGNPDLTAGGRARIEKVFNENLFRTFSDKMRQPPLDVDLTKSAALLSVARNEAQRNNVDVLVTGKLDVKQTSQGPIYYDEFNFQEAVATVRMYRTDTGELIAEINDNYAAAANTAEAARKKALDFMLTRITQNLSQKLRDFWNNAMLDQSNFRLMINGVRQENLTSIYNLLKSLSPDLQIFEKAFYGEVLVVNIVFPGAEPGLFEARLREARTPHFIVNKVDNQHFELRML